jgi:hypothetical protein
MSLLSNEIIKLAKSIQLKKLIEAKEMSDKRDYQGKNKIMRELLTTHPKSFTVDSILDRKYVGVTHKPSGFKIHAPRNLIPAGIEYNLKKSK